MNEEANKLLYVIASRAKKRIYLFSEKGRRYLDSDNQFAQKEQIPVEVVYAYIEAKIDA